MMQQLSTSIRQFPLNGNVAGAVFLDLKKAFNTVNHEVIISKLTHQFNLFCSCCSLAQFIFGTSECENISNEQSGWSVPGIYFRSYSFLPVRKSFAHHLYADDTVFYVSAKNPCQASAILRRQIVIVSEWLQRNHLTINHQKNSINVFSDKKKST